MKKGENIPLPCGKCPPCVRKRVSGWSYRLVKEGERQMLSLFVTLTYSPEHMSKAYGNITSNNMPTLNKKHVQKFFKRLRKITETRIRNQIKEQYPNIKKSKIKINAGIRYYCAGEYGSDYSRPHYHIILFGAEQQDVIKAWIDPHTQKQIGYIDFGYDCSEKAIGYTLKYIAKERKIPIHSNDFRQPEFSIMSKGIGSNYLTPEMINWHKKDLEKRVYAPLKDGKKAPLPRYYKDKIYNSEEWGHLKGYLEKTSEQKEQEIRKRHPNYEHSVLQNHIASFKKMYIKEQQNRKL